MIQSNNGVEKMSRIIQVLEIMASDASLTDNEHVKAMLVDADITESQKLAIEAKDLDTLTETIHDLPEIKCLPIVPAEDDEDETENQDKLITAINC